LRAIEAWSSPGDAQVARRKSNARDPLPDETGIHAAAATLRGDQWDPRRWKMPLCIKKPLCMKLWVCAIPGRDAGMLPPEADTGGEAQIKRSFQEKSNVCLNSGAAADFALVGPIQWPHG